MFNNTTYFQIGDINFEITGQHEDEDGNQVLSCTLVAGQDVHLAGILRQYGDEVTLPVELAGIQLRQLSFDFTPATGAFTLDGTSDIGFEMSFGGVDLPIGGIRVYIAREVEGRESLMRLRIDLTTAEDIDAFDGFTFKGDSSLCFQWNPLDGEEEDTWVISGSMGADILESEFQFDASATFTPTSYNFTLESTHTSTEKLLDFEGIATLDANAIRLDITRLRPGEQPAGDAVQVNTESPYTWKLSADCKLVLPIAESTQSGTLSIENDGENIIFTFEAENSDLKIPLNVPEHPIALHMGLNRMVVSREHRTTDPGTRPAWAFEAYPQMWFSDAPDWLTPLIGTMEGSFAASTGSLTVGISRLFEAQSIDLPPLTFTGEDIPLGTLWLDASKFSLTVSSEQRQGSMQFNVGIPEELNRITGSDTNFFTTYNGTEESMVGFVIEMDSVYGMTFRPLTSPIAWVQDDPARDGWSIIDFGEFGAFSFMMPTFGFTGSALNAQVGFEQYPERPLRIPLTPFKWLLESANMQALADLIPSSLPVTEWNLFNDDGTVNMDDFREFLETLAGGSLPEVINDALDTFAEAANRLPDGLKQYLKFDLPSEFTLDMAISTTGSARIDFKTADGEPLRLVTLAGLPLPSLVGIELHSFMLGELFTGSLFTTDVNARVDVFDLVTMAAAMALPLEDLPLIEDANMLQRRLVIDKLFMLIVYQTGIPLPIPLFFNELALEYYGLEGAIFQTHFEFPMPQPDMAEVLTAFDQFKQFFTDRDYLLDPKTMPQELLLPFTIGANYLQLPEYLGGKMLGSEDKQTHNVGEPVVHLLNAIKTLSIDEIVQAVPLQPYRMGSHRVAFAGIEFGTDWLITTPKEFADSSARLVGLEQNIENALHLVPRDINSEMSGLIAFLRGGIQFSDAAYFDTVLALAATNAGLRTRVSANGHIASLLDAGFQGTFFVEPDNSPVFGLAGSAYFDLLNHRIFDASLSINDHGMVLDGNLSVFPPNPIVNIEGHLYGRINRDEIYIEGEADFVLGQNFKLLGGHTIITQNGVSIDAEVLNHDLHFSLMNRANAITLHATMGAINLANLFILRSPQVYIDTSKGLEISGGVSVLGMSLDGVLRYQEPQFMMRLDGKLFNLFEAYVQLTSETFTSAPSIAVDAGMKAGFNRELARLVAEAIEDKRNDLNKAFNDARSEVGRWGDEVSKFSRQMEDRKVELQAEIDELEEKIEQAESIMQGWKDKLQPIDGQIRARENDINAFNRGINDTLDDLRDSLADALSLLSSALEILKNVAKIDFTGAAQRAVDEAQAEVDRLRAAITAEENKKISLDLDPLLSVLRAVKTAVNSGISFLQTQVNTFNAMIEKLDNHLLDGIFIALQGSLDVAESALDQANNFLAILQETSGDMLDMLNGLGDIAGLIQIHDASFHGSLDAVSDGAVNLNLDVSIEGERHAFTVKFDFYNLDRSAKRLAEMVIVEMLYDLMA